MKTVWNYNIKSFVFNGKTINYFMKDVDIKSKEIREKEMASAFMVVRIDEQQPPVSIGVYDEKYKVLYAMPDDAERWYIEHLRETNK